CARDDYGTLFDYW
nr:immunoglobulin heavy chain junction region [Macaca mulatta]MOV56455.1 immunoglobulin heavy chain junction region [Macaca mulatta]MOV57312.1 immunoglobulin heavy chain junction region [Macaca mulatta]